MNIKYIIKLNSQEQAILEELTSKGTASARVLKRANILLLCAQDKYEDKEIANILSSSTSTIFRVKRNFTEGGLDSALYESARPGVPKKLSSNDEALLVSIACSTPPEGRARWTLSLLSDELITLTDLESISLETVRNRLHDNSMKPWQKKMWCIGKMTAEYIAKMEHILDLYAEPANARCPIINFDEAGKQLVSDISEPISVKPGSPMKQDYEYQREGMANIYIFFDRHRGWRHAKVTEHKKAVDFAHCMKELVDIHYPNAEKIRVVLDNLNTHCAGSLYKAFSPNEARRIMKRIEFHYTPKHASWLNMAEIEISVMNKQCLDRRIGNIKALQSELSAWEQQRNSEKASIDWMFDVTKARTKLHRAYDGLKQSESF